MSEKESRPSGGTLEQQMELADFSYSISDCNTKPRRIPTEGTMQDLPEDTPVPFF